MPGQPGGTPIEGTPSEDGPSEGRPCWVDGRFADPAAAQRFYGDVLDWTFVERPVESGGGARAYADGRAVADLVPPPPGQAGQSAWCLYFASPDAAATARRIRAAGGRVLTGPAETGRLGTVLLAADPGGVPFGVRQSGTAAGVERRRGPDGFSWAEVYTRDPAASDAFFTAVFPYGVRRMEDGGLDFKVFDLDGEPVLGRLAMTDEFPPGLPPYIGVYFTVRDCDAAVATTLERGGRTVFGPLDSPFGRFAALIDPHGAAFAVLDPAEAAGELAALPEPG
ncbi:VOC family protein [Kitasatospora sp. NPDC048540]|uniref:VOC family protein n=1 Tax=Kitasatospora sp. NPDC048540 TaxID=3155634 RepID=UPI0033C42DBC